MKSIGKFVAASLLAASLLPFNAFGASLLGGVLGGGNGGSLPIVGGLLGNGGVNLPVDLGEIDLGVDGVVGISTSSTSNGGSSVGVTVLGGGGSNVGANPLGLLGDGGLDIDLPDLGIGTDNGGNGGNGGGGNGGNGGNGGAGGAGGGGTGGGGNGAGPIIKYYSNGGGGSGFAIPSGISSRLKALLRILAERDYLRVSNGRAVCLNSFGIAEVAGWVPQKEWGALQQALAGYSQDIYVLRQLLANCRNAAQRQALNLTELNRVIAIDIGNDGRPVLFML